MKKLKLVRRASGEKPELCLEEGAEASWLYPFRVWWVGTRMATADFLRNNVISEIIHPF